MIITYEVEPNGCQITEITKIIGQERELYLRAPWCASNWLDVGPDMKAVLDAMIRLKY